MQINESLELKLELNIRNDIKYKVEIIENNAVYITKTASQLSEL